MDNEDNGGHIRHLRRFTEPLELRGAPGEAVRRAELVDSGVFSFSNFNFSSDL